MDLDFDFLLGMILEIIFFAFADDDDMVVCSFQAFRIEDRVLLAIRLSRNLNLMNSSCLESRLVKP